MSQVEFSPERLERSKKIIAKYERPASALLPMLYLAQEQFGFLTPSVLDYVASLLGIAPIQAYEAASFYLLFKKKDMGKYCLQVCNNITCTMMGSEELLEVVRQECGIGPNEVSSDNLFSLVPVQCLGSCDTAPVVQINEDYHEKLTSESLRELIKKLKTERIEKPKAPEVSL